MISNLHLHVTKSKKKTIDGQVKKQSEIQSFFSGKNPDVYQNHKEVHEFEQKSEKSEKWTLKVKPKSPKLPTVRGRAREMTDREIRFQKADLKRRLDLNTEKMEAIEKNKKKHCKEKCCIKVDSIV